jgi:hypothetical protein
MAWVDRVLAAMGFGVVFRSWIATLHRDAAAAFLLNIISRPVPVNFSIRQGDPLSSILFIIYIEPFLKQLERELVGLFMAGGREVGFGYIDDVEIISGDIRDLHLVDVLCRRFEAAAGAILNRNRKTVILGLGSWAGRLVWPLPWIRAASPVKVLGFNIAADLASTQQATWDRVLAAVRSTVGGFSSRLLPTLRQKVDVIITFALSRVWYFCQVLAMPPEVAADIRRCISSYLWKGRTERLAFDELHSPREKGGLGLPCIQTRAEALFTKQYAQFVAAGGRMAAHVAFWLGPQLHHLVPYLPVLPPPPPPLPSLYVALHPLLEEAAAVPAAGAALALYTSRMLYQAWTSDLPPPKVEYRLHLLPWRRVWRRLEYLSPSWQLQDTHFSLLHNILPTPDRLCRLQLEQDASCRFCAAPVADVLHLFTACARVAAAWAYLYARASARLGAALTDQELLFLAWRPGGAAEDEMVVPAVTAYSSWVWESQDSPAVLLPEELRLVTAVAVAPQGGHPPRTIFN